MHVSETRRVTRLWLRLPVIIRAVITDGVLSIAAGKGWSRSTSESRRTTGRLKLLPVSVWMRALPVGIIGLLSILLFHGVMGRLVTHPQQQQPDISHYPIAIVLLWLGMSAVVAGVIEEISFRG